MAEYRSIHTKMWREDDWFQNLEPDARLFWVYLLTNPSASVAGIYRVTERTMIFESGLSQERVRELKRQFTEAHKAYFEGDVVWVRKMREYQLTENPSAKVKVRADKDVAAIPDCELKKAYQIAYGYSINRVGIPRLTDTDTDTETDTEENKTEQSGGGGASGPFAAACNAYHANIGMLTPMTSEKLKDDVDTYGAEWVVEAIGIAVAAEHRDLRYVEGILKRWQRDGKSRENGNGKTPAPREAVEYYVDNRVLGVRLHMRENPDGTKTELGREPLKARA